MNVARLTSDIIAKIATFKKDAVQDQQRMLTALITEGFVSNGDLVIPASLVNRLGQQDFRVGEFGIDKQFFASLGQSLKHESNVAISVSRQSAIYLLADRMKKEYVP